MLKQGEFQMNGEQYALSARVLHWLMAVGFLGMWVCGFVMTTLVEEDSPLEETLFDLHISFGVTLLALLVIRVLVRVLRTPPLLPESIRGIERIGAHAGHIALYVMPASIIVLGWSEVELGGHVVTWFGIEVPKILPIAPDDDLGELAELLHMWFAYTMLGIAVVHVAAVVKHRYWDGHSVLYRMSLRKHNTD